jgi:hypothetical protein
VRNGTLYWTDPKGLINIPPIFQTKTPGIYVYINSQGIFMMTHKISEARKLAELRALTDRQLTALIANRLERGFALAWRLERKAGGSYEDLTRLCSEIERLLPAVGGADRARLQAQFAQLQDAMNFGMPIRTAS